MKKLWILPFIGFIANVSIGSVPVPIPFLLGNSLVRDMPMERVWLLPYNPAWADTYKSESAQLKSILSSKRVIDIQHFGSTSIPGMLAKPIIDIIVGLDTFGLSDGERASLAALGYDFIEESPYCQRYYYHKRVGQKVNLSITVYNSATWLDCLTIRDYLRTHQVEREAYIEVKVRALLDGHLNIDQYSQYKRDFVRKLSDRARAWRSDR